MVEMAKEEIQSLETDIESLKEQVLIKAQELLDGEAHKRLRTHRDILLQECDWTQGADSPLSDEKKAEWAHF